jgi:hypothetical protein
MSQETNSIICTTTSQKSDSRQNPGKLRQALSWDYFLYTFLLLSWNWYIILIIITYSGYLVVFSQRIVKSWFYLFVQKVLFKIIATNVAKYE